MKSRVYYLIVVMIGMALALNAQSISIPADSSKITFSNNVAINIKRTAGKFELDLLAMKTLLVQINYWASEHRQCKGMTNLLQREISIRDSVQSTLVKRNEVERDRAELFSHGFEASLKTSAHYDLQLRALLEELAAERKQNHKARRKSFVRGMMAGMGSLILVGAVVIIAAD